MPKILAKLIPDLRCRVVELVTVTMLVQPLLELPQVNRLRVRGRRLRQSTLCIELPLLLVLLAAVYGKGLVRFVEYDLNGRHLGFADEQRLVHEQVFDNVWVIGKQRAGQSKADLAVTGRREDNTVPEPMIVQIGEPTRI